MAEKLTHENVIQSLVTALATLNKAIRDIDPPMPMHDASRVFIALAQSDEAQALYTNWLLSERK